MKNTVLRFRDPGGQELNFGPMTPAEAEAKKREKWYWRGTWEIVSLFKPDHEGPQTVSIPVPEPLAALMGHIARNGGMSLADYAKALLEQAMEREKQAVALIANRKLAYVTVKGEERAAKVASALVGRSTWFVVEPQPDDEWEFTVKAGEGHEGFIETWNK